MLFRERQQTIICILAGAIVSVFAVFWYLPLHKRIKTIDQAKSEQALAIAKGDADGRQLAMLKEQLQQLRGDFGKYEANVPEQRSVGEFLGKIADLMNENNLKDQQITPGKEIEADKLNCIPVSMQCKGELAQIFKFYRQLQGMDRMVRIEKVMLTNDSSYNGRASMTTEVVVYYRTKVEQG